MRKRQDRFKRRAQENELDQFEAYGEYSYAYKHPEKNEIESAESEYDPFEAEAAHSSPRRASRIPLEKETSRRSRSTVIFGRLLFLLGALVAMLVILQNTVFRLKTVYVVGNVKKTPQEITALSGLVKGLNIFSVNEEEVRENLKKDHTVEFLGMQKEYPSTVYLYIAERAPIAAIYCQGLQYTLDAQCLVMEESNSLILPEGVPVVTGFDVTSIHVGQPLEVKQKNQVDAYVAVMAELGLQLYMDQISELNLSDPDNLYLVTVDGITVRLGTSQYARAKVGAMRTDMAYIRQLGKTSGFLDVSIPHDAKFMPED